MSELRERIDNAVTEFATNLIEWCEGKRNSEPLSDDLTDAIRIHVNAAIAEAVEAERAACVDVALNTDCPLKGTASRHAAAIVRGIEERAGTARRQFFGGPPGDMIAIISQPDDSFTLLGERSNGRREEVSGYTKEVMFVPCPDGTIAAVVGVWLDDGRFYSWVWYSDPFGTQVGDKR